MPHNFGHQFGRGLRMPGDFVFEVGGSIDPTDTTQNLYSTMSI